MEKLKLIVDLIAFVCFMLLTIILLGLACEGLVGFGVSKESAELTVFIIFILWFILQVYLFG